MNAPRTKQLISWIGLVGLVGLIALSARAAQVPQEQCRSESGGYCVNIAAIAGAAQTGQAIPGLEFLRINRGAPIGDVIEQIYILGISLAGLAAFGVFIYGGFEYMFAGDKDPTAAKERMKNAIKGLALALGSWLILYTINPALVQKTDLGLRPLQYAVDINPASNQQQEIQNLDIQIGADPQRVRDNCGNRIVFVPTEGQRELSPACPSDQFLARHQLTTDANEFNDQARLPVLNNLCRARGGRPTQLRLTTGSGRVFGRDFLYICSVPIK